MPLDRTATLDRLRRADFQGLFTQELGWDWHTAHLSIPIDGKNYTLTRGSQAEALTHGVREWKVPFTIGSD